MKVSTRGRARRGDVRSFDMILEYSIPSSGAFGYLTRFKG